MWNALPFVYLILTLQAPFSATHGQADLRARVEQATRGGVSAEELQTLGAEALRQARAATSRSGFWNAVSAASVLMGAVPFSQAHELRAQALELLSERDSDSMRWSALVVEGFLPAFAEIPREHWAEEIRVYDKALDLLCSKAKSARVRAELKSAKAYTRVFINRRWDWLSAQERGRTLALLGTIGDLYGSLPQPGCANPQSETIAQRVQQQEYELRDLYFGAKAPATSGIDLQGNPLGLADYVGQVVVLDFWTTFCQPCLALVPGITELMDEFEGQPVVYLGVNGDTNRLQGLETAKRFGMSWRNLWDGPLGTNGPAAKAWNVSAMGWPTVFVIDSLGRIRYKLWGKQQIEAELKQAVGTLLPLAKAPAEADRR